MECHAALFQGHSLEKLKKTCVECHGQGYDDMTQKWQKEVSDRMKRLKLSIEPLKSRKKLIPNPEKNKVEALTREVEALMKAVEEDESKGVHNFTYAQRLISEAEEKILSLERALSK